MRHLGFQALPGLVQPPADRGQPGEAAFDQDDLERRGSARRRPPPPGRSPGSGRRWRVRADLLDVEARPAAIGHGPAADSRRRGRRPAGRPRPRPRRSASSAGCRPARRSRLIISDLAEFRVAGALADLGGGGGGVLVGHHDAAAQARLLPQPVLELPLVHGMRHGGGEGRCCGRPARSAAAGSARRYRCRSCPAAGSAGSRGRRPACRRSAARRRGGRPAAGPSGRAAGPP